MPNATILLADDDLAIRTVLTEALSRAGYEVHSTSNASTLWTWVSEGQGDLVLSDVVMPDGDGLELLPRIKKIRPDLPIIIMSARNTLATAVKATQGGAYEYLPKPFDINSLESIINMALIKNTKNDQDILVGDDEALPIIGHSPAMQEIYRLVARLTDTDLTVLISGESGTGKELVAKALHDFGHRKKGPFIAINMAAVPRDLIESELFGHEKGAFTGAINKGAGRFSVANGGTLFLDEIGDMPLEAQTRLLRVLQQGEYTTVGGRDSIPTDVRIIAATNKNLRSLVKQGQFREDLYYRLNVVPINMPPLRDRTEDIPSLVRYFLIQSQEDGLSAKILDQEALEELKQYNWPGNVRELENLILRLSALNSEDIITADIVKKDLITPPNEIYLSENANESIGDSVERHLQRYFSAHNEGLPPSGLYERIITEVEKPIINISLRATNGNQIKASKLLGLNRNTLRKKIRELGIITGRK